MAALTRELLDRFAARDMADPEGYPADSVRDLFEIGAIGAPLPSALGGNGEALEESIAKMEQIAAASGSLALITAMPLGFAHVLGVPASLAPIRWREKWEEGQSRHAQAYAGRQLYAACNSEKGAGGDLSATKTTAALSPAGGFQVTGTKILATSGKFASMFYSTARVDPAELPGAGVVEVYLVETTRPGVTILNDWDGFGMRSSESHTVEYSQAAGELFGFPNFFDTWQPFQCFYPLFAAIPLGCVKGILEELSLQSAVSPGLRLRFNEALMRYEAMRAYLLEAGREWHIGMSAAERSRVLRVKTYVSSESTRLAAELFALGGGRNYQRSGRVARLFSDAFAGTALRPPLALAVETMASAFAMPGEL